MNLTELHRKLIAAARADTPSDRVPYAFAGRVMARIADRPAADALALWGRALWRAAMSCVALMLLLGALAFFTPSGNSSTTDLSQAFEQTLFAGVEQLEASW